MHYAMPPERRDPNADIPFNFTHKGSAFIDGSIAQMDCHVVNEHVAGDHTIFIGEVDEIEVHDGKPLLYCEGKFGRFDMDGA